MKIKTSFLIVCISLIISACTQKEKTCIITGKVINRPQSTQIMLSKSFEDNRTVSPVMIPIEDSAFYYELAYTENEAYKLIFEDEHNRGSWRPITFFLNSGTVEFELYPMEEYKKNIVSGGKMNDEFFAHEKQESAALQEKLKSTSDRLQALMDNNEYESEKMKALFEELENAETQEDKVRLYALMDQMYKSDDALSKAAQLVNSERSSIAKIHRTKELQYRKEHLSIPNYYSHIEDMINSAIFPKSYDQGELLAVQKTYAQKFKNHSYTTYSNEVAWRLENLKPGGDFFDFKLPDLNGDEHTLSNEIKGKYAFIDIWAPWCGPCIAKSRAMKPVYENYKNKGFTVVGVSTKYEEISDVENLLEKDKYPWLTLIDKPELDSRINEHYGIEMAGGGCVLVDKAGKVVLANPTVEEVKKVLESNLEI